MALKEFVPSHGDILDGKYRLTRELGRGGMGVVYEAIRLQSGQKVAIKIALANESTETCIDYLCRFLQEMRVARMLRGAHHARLLDDGLTNDHQVYMVMELLKGLNLRDELARRGTLPIIEAVRYVREACAGMREAHRKGIIHRDLKPSNLFLSVEGDKRVIKVIDFGIAKILTKAKIDVSCTATNARLGTCKYMSPEQAESPRSVDARTDIWSLGVVLYELLSGKAPFVGEGAVGTSYAIATQAPPPLRNSRPDVPAGLAAVIERALCKDVAGRYQTIHDFSKALAPFERTGVWPSSHSTEPAPTPGRGPRAMLEGGVPTPPPSSFKSQMLLACSVVALGGLITFASLHFPDLRLPQPPLDALARCAKLAENSSQVASVESALPKGRQDDPQRYAVEHLATLHRFADFYRRARKGEAYDRAEPLYRCVFEIREAILGADHPDTARTLGGLGLLYYEQGRRRLAEPNLARALTVLETAAGPVAPELVEILQALADISKAKGEGDRERDYLLRALDAGQRDRGPGTSWARVSTVERLDDLMQRSRTRGDFILADTLYEQAAPWLEPETDSAPACIDDSCVKVEPTAGPASPLDEDDDPREFD
jgi:eukaryotic-like serine/threonine-protein kinase